ncbi:hypothetical protein T484DRAFT_3615708 [Baffinella frigidus]|nr:hypothetical protein T484DRAFT_3615708 [Cryptophyta sp. CCMP2293]
MAPSSPPAPNPRSNRPKERCGLCSSAPVWEYPPIPRNGNGAGEETSASMSSIAPASCIQGNTADAPRPPPPPPPPPAAAPGHGREERRLPVPLGVRREAPVRGEAGLEGRLLRGKRHPHAGRLPAERRGPEREVDLGVPSTRPPQLRPGAVAHGAPPTPPGPVLILQGRAVGSHGEPPPHGHHEPPAAAAAAPAHFPHGVLLLRGFAEGREGEVVSEVPEVVEPAEGVA